MLSFPLSKLSTKDGKIKCGISNKNFCFIGNIIIISEIISLKKGAFSFIFTKYFIIAYKM